MNALARCDYVGSGATLRGAPYVLNRGRISIGDDFRLSSQPVQSHIVADTGGEIWIGHGVRIGHGSGLASRARIRIGDGVTLGAYVLVLDTDFHVAGDAGHEAPATPIEIGPNARLGNHVTVLRGSVIGAGAVVADGSVISGEIPAGAHVAGVPARRTVESTSTVEGGSIAERLTAVAMRVFSLAERPELSQGPLQTPGWDSLGTLSLILALEDEFRVSLAEEDVVRAANLLQLTQVIERASSRSRHAGSALP
jgi:acetyltransferase-like isoleucine patch superfamily enzyme/acyl carrier protein